MDGGRTGEVRVIGASGKACRFLTIFVHVSAGHGERLNPQTIIY